MSPYHLAHVFRREVGLPVYAYVLRLRLAQALSAVVDSDADITTIALDAGFASHSHFTLHFRTLFGVTPAALRRGAGPRPAELRKIVTAR
jgi:AraC-like DNA-binding protein